MTYIRNSTVTFSFFQNGAFSHDDFRALATHGICTEYAPWRFPAIVLRVRRRAHGPNNNNNNVARHATALLFRSGRVVMTGVNASADTLCSTIRSMAQRVRQRAQRALRASGRVELARTLTIQRLTTRNLVSTVRVPFRVGIERLYVALRTWRRLHENNDDDDDNNNNNNNARPCIDGTPFVGLRNCCLDFCTFPALRCTLGMADQQQQQRFVTVTYLLFANGRAIVTGVRQLDHLAQAEHSIGVLLNNYRR